MAVLLFHKCWYPAGSNNVDYLVVAGGGGGGGSIACTKVVEVEEQVVLENQINPSGDPWTASPLGNPTSVYQFNLTTYPITVGAGGAGGTWTAPVLEVMDQIQFLVQLHQQVVVEVEVRKCTSKSGDGGFMVDQVVEELGYGVQLAGTGGTGNTPPTSPPQGNNGTGF
jgi:hypothetical protein